jgi:hypothetical protein
MKWIWDIIGYGLIATGLLAFFINMSPMGVWISAISPPIGEGLEWYATCLELVIPFGLFFIISDMNPRKMAIASVVAIIAGVAIYLMGF